MDMVKGLMHGGSPPLTRGPLCIQFIGWNCKRITPAHAGTTIDCVRKFLSFEDHPRSRGDHKPITIT